MDPYLLMVSGCAAPIIEISADTPTPHPTTHPIHLHASPTGAEFSAVVRTKLNSPAACWIIEAPPPPLFPHQASLSFLQWGSRQNNSTEGKKEQSEKTSNFQRRLCLALAGKGALISKRKKNKKNTSTTGSPKSFDCFSCYDKLCVMHIAYTVIVLSVFLVVGWPLFQSSWVKFLVFLVSPPPY